MSKIFKASFNIFLILGICILGFACSKSQEMPMCVSFKEGTLAGSENYVITAVYLEDKRIRDHYTDIFIMVDKDNFSCKIGKELEKPFNINIPKKDIWFSLTQLINQKCNAGLEFTTFSKAEPTTYILQCKEKSNFKFKAVAGDFQQNLVTGDIQLINYFDVSKTFDLAVEEATTLD